MSGILRSFSKLVSQSTLAQGGHKLLLRTTNMTLHPTAYYYKKHPTQRLGNDLDVFQLSVTSAALARQANKYIQLLNNTEAASVRTEIEERLAVKVKDLSAYVEEVLALFRIGKNDFPVQSVADIAYVAAFGPVQIPNATQVIQNNLLPVLNAKLQYASVHNLQDILVAFVKLGLTSDKKLLGQLLSELAKKDFPSQLVHVGTHAWNTNSYEYLEEGQKPANILNCRANNFSAYIQGGGNESLVAKVKFGIQEAADRVIYQFVNPFFFRESRINTRFGKRNDEDDAVQFAAALNKLAEIVPEQAATISAIKAKL